MPQDASDDGDYADWIGREKRHTDRITRRLVAQYRATLAGTSAGGEIPPGFHWCLWPDIALPDELGRDGHPRPGLVLPKLPLPRRMWAGGQVLTHRAFAEGQEVERRSIVTDVTFKEGRSGRLGFVTVAHEYHAEGALFVSERQDIVYREDPDPDAPPPPAPAPAEDWQTEAAWHVLPTSTLLFRFSALTFNGHRIHYDQPYATGVEGYDDLVVHGPLQAVWMHNLATEVLGAVPGTFDYRGRAPLTLGPEVAIEARREADGLALRVRRLSDGVATMTGTARG